MLCIYTCTFAFSLLTKWNTIGNFKEVEMTHLKTFPAVWKEKEIMENLDLLLRGRLFNRRECSKGLEIRKASNNFLSQRSSRTQEISVIPWEGLKAIWWLEAIEITPTSSKRGLGGFKSKVWTSTRGRGDNGGSKGNLFLRSRTRM